MPVVIEDVGYLFLLDTGATGSVLDLSFKSMLGEPLGTHRFLTALGERRWDLYAHPEIRLGSVVLNDSFGVACRDMSSYADVIDDVPLLGILGVSSLADLVVQVDLDSLTVTIWDSLPRDRDLGSPMPLRMEPHGVPDVEAEVGGRNAVFTLDTACGGFGTLASALFDDLIEDGSARLSSGGSIVVMGDTVNTRSARIDTLRLGPFSHDRVFMRRATESVLGLPYLSRYLVTFDFPGERVWLRKSSAYDAPSGDCCGAVILLQHGSVVATIVDAGGPAHRSGLREGDVILAANGRAVTDWWLANLQQAVMRCCREQVVLEVEREGAQLTLTLAK